MTSLLPALPLLLGSTFVVSLAEDILTRGFWYRASGIRWRGGVVFLLVSSDLRLNHIYRLGRWNGWCCSASGWPTRRPCGAAAA